MLPTAGAGVCVGTVYGMGKGGMYYLRQPGVKAKRSASPDESLWGAGLRGAGLGFLIGTGLSTIIGSLYAGLHILADMVDPAKQVIGLIFLRQYTLTHTHTYTSHSCIVNFY